MCQKTTLVKSATRKISKNWEIDWCYINRGRDAKSHRWIRSLTVSVDLSKSAGFTGRVDLLKKFHIEISIRKTKIA